MNVIDFITLSSARLVPVFELQREVTVKAYVWNVGSSPLTDPVEITLPKGTFLLKGGYSNFGDGYSMEPHDVKVLGKIKQPHSRWFRIDYADMKYLHHEVKTDSGAPPVVVKVK